MFTKSRWGVIGESKNPGGIIYLDLDFSQPADCRLESATITVTLTEDDGEEAEIPHRFGCPVKFTDHYGPKCVRGPESFVQTRKIQNRTPEVQLFGYGAGGLGINKEKVIQTRGRWDFSGYISSTKDSIWYNRLRWELKENSLEWQPTHSNLFHTAFALEHNATRFYMTVHVSGKLAKLSDKIKSKLKFGEKGGKDQEIVTKIEWAEGYSCPLRLDEAARDLHEAMGYANMTKVPVEIPDALTASYHPAITNPVTPTLSVEPPPGNPQVPQIQPPTRPWLEARPLASTGGETSLVGNPMKHLPALTLEELSMAAAGFAHYPSHPPRPPPLKTSVPAAAGHEEISESSSSVTLVNSTVPTQVGEGDSEPATDTCQKDWERNTDKSKSRSAGSAGWLGVTAILLYWLAKVGVLLSGLATVVAVPSTPRLEGSKGKKRNKNKLKMIGIDGGSESSRTKTSAMKLGHPVRGRPRARRGQRPYLNVDVGRRKRQQWEDIESNSSN
jgi:hypothetical protein